MQSRNKRQEGKGEEKGKRKEKEERREGEDYSLEVTPLELSRDLSKKSLQYLVIKLAKNSQSQESVTLMPP